MENLIEQLISDFQERELPSIKLREATLPGIVGKIDTVIGMRRAGKTSFLYQIIHHYLQSGLPKNRILYINFDDERLLPLKVTQLHLILDIFFRLHPELKNEKCYFFFDEIQNVDGWEKFIRRLLDTENVHIVLTGSSAKLLSKEIATSLRGRAIATEIFPYSFRETLIHERPDVILQSPMGSRLRAWIANRFRQFLIRGGFPEVQSIEEEYRIRILQEYVDIVLLRDIIERHKISNPQVLRVMVRCLLNAPASLFSLNKFYTDLKSQGLSCTKNSLYDYLDYLHDAYLIFPISICSRSERVKRTNPRKIYVIDTGLVKAFLHQPPSDWGRLLENFVFLELRRKGLAIEYYRTRNDLEVDFITTSIRGERALYQVTLNLENEKTKTREIVALETAMKECDLKEGKIITLDQRESIKLKDVGKIEVLPIWEFAVM